MRKLRLSLWLSVCCLLLTVLVPRAGAVTYYFDTANDPLGPWTGAIPPGYGYVDVTQENGTVFFEVGANSSYFQGSGPGLTWDKFYFNVGNSADISDIEVLVEVGNWSLVQDRNVSQFGRFDLGLHGTSFGDAANNPLNFAITGTSLSVDDFAVANAGGWLFAGHLRRFESINGENSTFLGVGSPDKTPAPVPEPGTILLIGTGLASLALRRKKAA